MTSLRKRLDNVLAELAIIQEGLEKSSKYPPCCLTIYNDGKIGCDVLGPLSEEQFLYECGKCQATIEGVVNKYLKSTKEFNETIKLRREASI